ncbi:MAG: ATP-binding protein [Methylovulum sp.]|nr:ATP-binding protein [Methylovulum sp.]
MRTIIILVVSTVLVGSLFINLAGFIIANRFHLQAHDRLGALIDTVERTASIACYLPDPSLANEVAQGLMKHKEVASVIIFDAKQAELAAQSRPVEHASHDEQHGLVEIRRAIPSPFDPDKVVGELILVPDHIQITRSITQSVDDVKGVLILELLVLSLVVAGMIVLMIIRPIKRISNDLHAMDAPAGDQLLPPRGHAADEIGGLVTDINHLARHLVFALREEQELRWQREAGEKKYQALFDHAEAGICLLDRDGRVLSHNPAFARLTGLGLAPNTGNNAPQLTALRCSEPEKISVALGACLRSGITVTEDIELRASVSGRLWLHLILTPLGQGQIQGIISDITELTLSRLAAENANLAKSTFLTNMSHELRTPLNAIIGFSQLLEMGELTPLVGAQQIAVRHIMDSGRHLLELINEILDLARIESGMLALNIENVGLDALRDEVLSLIRPIAAAHQVNIEQVYCTDGQVTVRADALRLRQIFLNLLSNAVKYNREGGSVTLSCAVTGNDVCMSVTDTGMGIAEADRAKLFQPFQRLNAGNTAIEGTGIGLVVCKRLVEAMGGRIGFDSRMGVGSRFWIVLPLAGADHAAAAMPLFEVTRATAAENFMASGQVLYIEDSLINIKVMKHVFSMLPSIELCVAETAETGLAMVHESLPDLVLMDINLPGMSGLEALKQLKADPQTAAIPVIAVSAAAMANDVEAGLVAGFDAYLTKPFGVSELMTLVRRAMQKNARQGRGI